MNMERTVLAIVVAAALLGGCAAASPRPSDARFALLPAAWRTRDPWPELDERERLERAMPASVAIVRAEDECGDETECAREAGRSAGADRVVVTTMASLGDTVLARVNVLDVTRGTREQMHQRVVRDADAESVGRAIDEIGRALVESPPGGTPWWPWTVGAAVIVAAAIAVAVGVVLASSAEGPDIVVRPP